MKITSGEYEVIYSGTVIGAEKEPIEFQFPPERASIKIIIDFRKDSKIKDSPIEFDFPDNKTLKMTLVNVTDLGSGNTSILEIGNIEDRKLFMNYRVYSIKDISKTIHYTFYLGKEGSYVKQ
jgi:hypothetical protein